jgi:hypothetical protein
MCIVMAGLVPAIHVFGLRGKKDVDGRDKPGHDGEVSLPPTSLNLARCP